MSASSLFPRKDIDVWRNSTRERERRGGWTAGATQLRGNPPIRGFPAPRICLLLNRRPSSKNETFEREIEKFSRFFHFGNNRFCEKFEKFQSSLEGNGRRMGDGRERFHYIVSTNGRRWLTASEWNDGHAWNSKDPEGNPFLTDRRLGFFFETHQGRLSSYLFPILALELNLLYRVISFFFNVIGQNFYERENRKSKFDTQRTKCQ